MTIVKILGSWSSRSEIDQFTTYTRYSVLLSLPLVALALGVSVVDVVSSSIPGTSHLPTVISAVVAGVVPITLATMRAVNAQPSLRVHPDPRARSASRFATQLSAITFTVGVALMAVNPNTTLFVYGVGLAWASLSIAAFGLAPWWPRRWWIIGVGTALVLLMCLTFVPVGPLLLGCILPPFLLSVTLVAEWSVRLFAAAERSSRLEATLSANEERLRIAHELHDTMGQHLAALSLKIQVAKALAQRNDARLLGELKELEDLASLSTRDMRQVVYGIRHIDLERELAGGVELLRQSGIHTTVEGSDLDLHERERELAAWFVREAITNILRHSRAGRARITLAPHLVMVSNDGVDAPVGELSGLASLHKRAMQAGLSLRVSHDGDEFTVSLHQPEAEGSSPSVTPSS